MLAVEVGGESIAELGARTQNVHRSLLLTVGGAERVICRVLNEALRLFCVALDHRLLEDCSKLIAVTLFDGGSMRF